MFFIIDIYFIKYKMRKLFVDLLVNYRKYIYKFIFRYLFENIKNDGCVFLCKIDE